jgi:hypothetical protein
MLKTRVGIALVCCTVAMASFAFAQGTRKAGLYETTSSMTWQQSPFPQGMQMPPQAAAAFGGGGPHTVQVCLTQAMIDKYGAPPPQQRDCQMSDVSIKPTGMTATLVCTGRINGTGTVETTFTEGGTAKGKVHFTGTMAMGQNSRPVEWTNEFTSVYKGPDCGSVQPPPMPKN